MFYPNNGEQACGETGTGRMVEAVDLADLLEDLWTPKLLSGKKVLITAGATFEAIDPVRGITNISSGQMGMALARACRAAGAKVTLIYGQIQTACRQLGSFRTSCQRRSHVSSSSPPYP